MLIFLICNSYWKHTKKYLLEGIDFTQLPDALYNAPFVCLAHNRFQEGVTDPQFIYANHAALELWETSWDELIGLPSRLSAPPVDDVQQERNGLLGRAAETGVITNYEGLRVSVRGTRFRIRGVTLFNVMDLNGTKLGQAAVFDEYEREDGTVVKVTAPISAEAAAAAAAAAAVPSAEDIAAAEAAVKDQGDAVRRLKEVDGLTNQDIKVQLAVMELKKRKDKLAAMQKKVEDALAEAKAAFDDDE